MHLTHIKLKPTRKIETNFNPADIGKDIEIPKESVDIAKKYQKTNQYNDDYDLLMAFDDHLIYGFDFIKDKEKFLIPEINPTTIFYSNAVMSHRKLIISREELFKKSPTIKNYNKSINPNHFGSFFQLASNCIINLQSTLESFANRQIPEDRKFFDKNEDEFDPSVFHKIDKILPEIYNKRFKSSYKKDNFIVRKIIELRNEIIHLKPIKENTNTKYKDVYRRLLKFDFTRAIIAVRKLVNFYESNLIEDCECEKELYYDVYEKIKE